ncbi:RNA-directed DNA polymerase from mobile element jockey-like protein [Pitangus sulphuratus]|nr:RNA-directed DNA polymerase from mobile element jockey-like protein [Pitangus sulphuratus]
MIPNSEQRQKGKKKDSGNYRPVSLFSVPSNVMEKIILGIIEKYLKGNAVIGHSQHGFMRGKSCLSNLISFYDKVVDQRKPVDEIFLDFSNAFKTASQKSLDILSTGQKYCLLDKKSNSQVDKHIVWCVSNWLRDRAQRVIVNEVNGVTSDW